VRYRALALVLMMGQSWVAAVRGDGGTLRHWERQGSYEIAVFTSPSPFVTGPVDISVLVLDSTSGEPVRNAKVSVQVEPVGRSDGAVIHPATTETATNKLLRAAVFELPEPGLWVVDVTIDEMKENTRVRFRLEAGHSPPHWIALWPWVCWPAPVILLYGIHQFLVE
jgi:hypothetical protein